MSVRHLPDALNDLWDEVVEMVEKPSLDEASDCAYAVGRLLAGLVGQVYVHVFGDARHIAKIDQRMAEYGCVRSKRHTVHT
jgi:hypothetical protein